MWSGLEEEGDAMKRLIRSLNSDGVSAKVYYNADYAEYVCTLIVAGCIELHDSSYYTSSREDALATASKMLRAELERAEHLHARASAV